MPKVLYVHISWYDAMIKLIDSVVYDYNMKKHKHKIFFLWFSFFFFVQVFLVFHAFSWFWEVLVLERWAPPNFPFFFHSHLFFQYAWKSSFFRSSSPNFLTLAMKFHLFGFSILYPWFSIWRPLIFQLMMIFLFYYGQFFRSEVLPRFRFSRVFPPKPFFLVIDFPMFLQF